MLRTMKVRLMLLCGLLFPDVVLATEPVDAPLLTPPPLCADDLGEEPLLIDRAHAFLSRRVCLRTQWFDRFFADPDVFQEEPATALLRVISGYRWQDNDDAGGEVRVRGTVNLPGLSQRISLTFRNDDDINEDYAGTSDTRPEQVGENEDSTFRAALNWAARQRERDAIDLEVGLGSRLKSFARTRYQYRVPLPGERWTFRFAESLYWIDGVGGGSETRFQFDRIMTERLSLRLLSEAETNEALHEEDLDWELSQTVALYQRLGSRRALQYVVGARGYTQPTSRVEVWRAGIRYRQNIFRRWLFFELEPFVFWSREEDFEAVSGVVARLETQFGLYDP